MQKNYSVISVCAKTILRTGMLWAAFVVSLSLSADPAKPPVLTWSKDTARIRIGEQIRVDLELRAPKDALIDFPNLRFASDSMEVVRRSKIDTSFKRDQAVYRVAYHLTSFEKGNYVVPAIEVRAGDTVLSTQAFRVHVAGVDVDTLRQARYGIKDIRCDRYTAGEFLKKYYWVLIVLAVLALLGWEIRRLAKQRREKKLPPEMLLSPYERARFRLRRLDGEKLLDEGRVKDFYIALTDVVRLYLDEQFGIPAPESTSDQTLRDVRRLHLTRQQYDKLRELLLDADLVKFAKMFPSEQENLRYRRYTEEIVESLRPDTETPENAPGESPQERKETTEHVGE